MKDTTTFSCSRTRRDARTQKGLMCPNIYNFVNVSMGIVVVVMNGKFLPQAGIGKNRKWFVDDIIDPLQIGY